LIPLVIAAVEYGGPFDVPPAGEIFNLPPLFEIAGVDITRVFFIVLSSIIFAMLLFGLAFTNAKIVPGKIQAAAESLVEFIRDGIATDIIGPEGRKFVPFLTTVFVFVMFNNLFKVIPFVNFPSTSRIAMPLFLALIVLVLFTVVGIRSQGLGYFKEVAFPPGVPKPVYLLLTPIEIVSTFILRPLTLTVRLFANMVAGHILLTVVFIAVHSFLIWGPGLPVGILVLGISPIAVAFEGAISILQAYIFVILTAVYISGALHPEH
jgi:F-type H+-transporting ATPase subunit a